ncbi:hypothetical protein K7G98_00540 [Saccharothrix sp. MB29]|nr:hypothetical protein [Saccharothrix sp. MB29]
MDGHPVDIAYSWPPGARTSTTARSSWRTTRPALRPRHLVTGHSPGTCRNGALTSSRGQGTQRPGMDRGLHAAFRCSRC